MSIFEDMIHLPELSPRARHILGSCMVLLSAVCFSSKAVMVKMAYRYAVDPLTLLFLRMIFSLPFFLVIAFYSSKSKNIIALNNRDYLMLVITGLLGYYLASLFDFMGLQYVSAGLERLILFIYPAIVLMLSALLYKYKIHRKEYFALLLTYAGIMTVFIDQAGESQKNLYAGAGLIFLSALTYSFYLIGSGRLIPRIGAERFTGFSLSISALAVIIHFLLTHTLDSLRVPSEVYLLGISMALLSTVAPSLMLSRGISMIGSGTASIVASVGPVSTIFLAYIFLGEQVTLNQLLGTLLVLTGVLTVSSIKR